MEPQETKELVRLVLVSVKALQEALADGKVSITDALKLLPVLKQIKPAFDGIQKIPAELKALDAETVKALVQEFQGGLDLPNDAIEGMIEVAFEVGLNIVMLLAHLDKKVA